MQKPSEGRVLPALGYFEHFGQSEKLGPNRVQRLQNMIREGQQMIPSLQLIISHQVRSYLDVVTI